MLLYMKITPIKNDYKWPMVCKRRVVSYESVVLIKQCTKPRPVPCVQCFLCCGHQSLVPTNAADSCPLHYRPNRCNGRRCQLMRAEFCTKTARTSMFRHAGAGEVARCMAPHPPCEEGGKLLRLSFSGSSNVPDNGGGASSDAAHAELSAGSERFEWRR